MQAYSVVVNGTEWYFGTNAANALDHIVKASETHESIAVSVKPYEIGVKKQCCAGVYFHASDCERLR